MLSFYFFSSSFVGFFLDEMIPPVAYRFIGSLLISWPEGSFFSSSCYYYLVVGLKLGFGIEDCLGAGI